MGGLWMLLHCRLGDYLVNVTVNDALEQTRLHDGGIQFEGQFDVLPQHTNSLVWHHTRNMDMREVFYSFICEELAQHSHPSLK